MSDSTYLQCICIVELSISVQSFNFINHSISFNFNLSGLLFTDISDHLPIFCILYEQHIDSNYDKYIFYRNKSEANISKFHDRLRKTNWKLVRVTRLQ